MFRPEAGGAVDLSREGVAPASGGQRDPNTVQVALPRAAAPAQRPWGWQHRHLLLNLVARDLKVRYRGSLLGFAWTFLNPLLMTGVFVIVFTRVFPMGDLGVPFPAFFLVGLLVWNSCTTSVAGALPSIVGNAAIVSKVYFPRAVLPLSAVCASMINFLLSLLVLLPILALFGIQPNWTLLYFPLILLAHTLFLVGLGLVLAILNVFFRDTAPIVEVLLQAWFFLTPIFYEPSRAVASWQGLDLIQLLPIVNPLAAVVTLYRQALLYGTAPDWAVLVRTLLICLACSALGVVVFGRFAGRIGDEL